MVKQDPRASEQLAREAVQAIRRAVANPDTVASIAEVYPTDLTRVRVLVDGQLAECLITNPEWSLHIGDRVYVQQLEDHSGRYILRGFVENAGPGAWWRDDVDPDLTTGQGPIPGTRRPHGDADSRWRDLGPNTTSGLLWGHHLAPKPGDETDTSLSERFRVYGGYTATPIESYGDFIVPGSRMRLVQDPGPVAALGPYCSFGEGIIQNGTLAGILPLGPGSFFPVAIHGRACPGHDAGKAMLNLGTILPTLAFSVEIEYTYKSGTDALLFWATNQPTLPDKWLTIAIYDNKPVIGISRELLAGVPAYPNGGIGGGTDPNSPSDSIWFPFAPYSGFYGRKIFGRNGEEEEILFYPRRMKVTYTVANPGLPYDAILTVTDGAIPGNQFFPKFKTYYLRRKFYDGFDTTLQGFAGDMDGMLVSPLTVNDVKHRFDKMRHPTLSGKAGELFWHRHVMLGDPAPGGGTYGEIGDYLEDGLYLFIADDKLVRFQPAPALQLLADRDLLPEWMDPRAPPLFPSHDQLGGLDNDDHPQYHTDARALAWLGTRTTTDLPDAPGRRYLTDAEKTGATVAKTTENLSSQIDDTKRVFTTAGTFTAGTLDVTLNSLALRRGIDFYERSARDGFEIDVRTPRTNPRDVLTVAYRPG